MINLIKYQPGEVLYTNGRYQVRVTDKKYEVVNSETNVVEHKTKLLYEAIRSSRVLEDCVRDISHPTWGRKREQEPTQLDLFAAENKLNS